MFRKRRERTETAEEAKYFELNDAAWEAHRQLNDSIINTYCFTEGLKLFSENSFEYLVCKTKVNEARHDLVDKLNNYNILAYKCNKYRDENGLVDFVEFPTDGYQIIKTVLKNYLKR